ncbi:sigma D regulator [Halomonas sp. McH1-25]|uniref:sigma D regulator n=1 Tax=unclassified Halomonas TaxID=2609666 RepID=UPI001EF60F17|nr:MULTISPECIES: sigma D regulator [unclassified Halomonas]MCG7600405.1 sigma D regulator [Halomonas sp. McH1-25]MCP1343171.1 sigma D regulator [Halomonas sp. FL8]MCP1361544.1 sigma D regulator [Halomonas sp. BBD45]MCP1367210.1 sigma D regulator [Halomonas sp. BBD48]
MLEDCKTALERWGGVHRLIDHWLEERHDMLVAFMDLNEACEIDCESVPKERIDRFNELLMDYISAGHFEIYPQLREEAKAFDDREALAVAEKLLARLEKSTEMALEFENEFSTPVRCQHFASRLPAWLTRLRKAMTERFALEDEFIERLHASHSPPPASEAAPSATL